MKLLWLLVLVGGALGLGVVEDRQDVLNTDIEGSAAKRLIGISRVIPLHRPKALPQLMPPYPPYPAQQSFIPQVHPWPLPGRPIWPQYPGYPWPVPGVPWPGHQPPWPLPVVVPRPGGHFYQ